MIVRQELFYRYESNGVHSCTESLQLMKLGVTIRILETGI